MQGTTGRSKTETMKYSHLKQERDDAIARAVEAERLSMKSEFDRVTREFEEEKTRMRAAAREEAERRYWQGFNDGLDNAARAIAVLPRKGNGQCYENTKSETTSTRTETPPEVKSPPPAS
jgi:hypothetical protein